MKLNHRFLTTTAALMLCLAALLACKKKLTGGDGKEGPGKSAAADPQQNKDRALSDKLQPAIYCVNNVNGRVMQSYGRYKSWMKDPKPEAGPTGKEKVVYTLYKPLSFQTGKCKKDLAANIKAEPKLAKLDKQSQEYLDALKELEPKIESAYDYYNQKKYKDDGFAKAKEMHKPLVDAFEKFRKIVNDMHHELSGQKMELDKRILARIEKEEGQKFRYWHKKTMMDAKVLLDDIEEGLETKSTDPKKLEGDLDSLDKTHKTADDYADKHPKDKPTSWSSFSRSVDDFLKAGREYMRRKRDDKKFTRSEIRLLQRRQGWMVEGTFDKVLREYNDMIKASNRLF